MNYVDKIRAVMAARSWTAYEYAKRTKIRESTIYALLSGRNADVRSASNRAVIDAIYREAIDDKHITQ